MDQNNRINGNRKSLENLFYDNIENFLLTTTSKSIMKQLDTVIIGQEEAKKTATVLLFEHIYKVRFDKAGAYKKQNLLMIGPSGCGKTEIMRQLKKIIPVNITIFDASSITQEGWKGDVKIQSIGEKVLSDCMEMYNSMQKITSDINPEFLNTLINTSIVVLDEFDKVVKPKYSGEENISVSLMGEMLKLFEDGTYQVTSDRSTIPFTIDYSRIPIIALGAFSELTSPKKASNAVGFATGEKKDPEEPEDKRFTTNDLIQYGLTHELAGRIQNIVTLSPLTKDDMLSIIKSDQSFVTEYKSLLSRLYGIELRFTEEAYEDIAEEALKSQTGARALETCLINIKNRIIWDTPGRCIVTITSHDTFKYRLRENDPRKSRSRTF